MHRSHALPVEGAVGPEILKVYIHLGHVYCLFLLLYIHSIAK
jgi:hypothetical protein